MTEEWTPEERTEELRYLTEECGLSQRDAEARLLDDDLWLLDPSCRCSLHGEEAVEQWRYAMVLFEWFSDDNPACNEAAKCLAWDVHWRAQEFLRRARQRVEGDK